MNRLQACFLANATTLCIHQIDAAYWHEWELFHIPGGNQFNLLLNVPIVASVFWAFWHVVSESRYWRLAHKYLVFLGFLTVSLHSICFALGYQQFVQSASIGLLVCIGLLSVLQLVLLLRIEEK